MKVIWSFVLFVAMATRSLWAWGDLGHQTVGELAERKLSPKARAFVRAIIGNEPLAVAAIWPDLVRSDPRFSDFSSYHFFEVPQPYSYEDIPETLRADKSGLVILMEAPRALVDRSRSREEKMILLRYLIHVVGDLHQPLHVGNGIDRGGNTCRVQIEDSEAQIFTDTNLHSFLDDGIFEIFKAEFISKKGGTGGPSKRRFGYQEMLKMVMDSQGRESQTSVDDLHVDLWKEGSLAGQKTVNTDKFSKWINEAIAEREKIYPDPAPVTNPKDRDYCDIRKTAVVRMSNQHIQSLIPMVYRQLALGGERLADLLNRIAEESNEVGIDEEAAAKILKAAQVVRSKS